MVPDVLGNKRASSAYGFTVRPRLVEDVTRELMPEAVVFVSRVDFRVNERDVSRRSQVRRETGPMAVEVQLVAAELRNVDDPDVVRV
jgi:hypothetical protein